MNARDIIAATISSQHADTDDGSVCPSCLDLADGVLAALEAAGFTIAKLIEVGFCNVENGSVTASMYQLAGEVPVYRIEGE